MRRRYLLPVTVILLFVSSACYAQTWSGILDPTRAVDWSQAGIPGGIPTTRTQCGSAIAAGASVTTIQNALNSCAANTYVLLGPGAFTINSHLTIPSNKTLRGSGPQNDGPTGLTPVTGTVLNITVTGDSAISFGPCTNSSSCGSSTYLSGTNTSITSGASQGSTSFVVASASGISVGTLIQLASAQPSYMRETNTGGGDCNWCPTTGSLHGQTVEVTHVAGTTITFRPPLYFDYQSAGSPKAYPFAAAATGAGLEYLRLYANSTGPNANIDMIATKYSWVKGVEGDFVSASGGSAHDHLVMYYSMGNEVRDCFFHDSYSHSSGASYDTEVKLGRKTSATLIVNSIFYRQHTSILMEWGPSGNVAAYNYFTGNYHDGLLTWQIEDNVINHGAHPFFNLEEGNIQDHFEEDDYWGSSSHNTLFRNYSTGSRQYVPPQNARGSLQPGSAQWEDGNAIAYSIDSLSRYGNLVGNIAGSAHLLTLSPTAFKTSGGNGPSCWRIGFTAYDDSFVSPNNTYSTAFVHGVNNCLTDAVTWDAGHPDHTLPASFFLSATPGWWATPWGTPKWPPIGPDVTGGNSWHGFVDKIPAQLCFENSTKDSTGRPIFDAAKCYAQQSGSGVVPPTNLTVVIN